jgi:OmcA/MtrC family decaheme c-type cytochrome
MRRTTWLAPFFLTLFALVTFMGGCSSSDSTPPGEEEPPPSTASYTALGIEITEAVVAENGALSVTFAVTDGSGNGVDDLTSAGFSFSAAQLVPSRPLYDGSISGDTPSANTGQYPYLWQSYINRTDAGAARANAPGFGENGAAKYTVALQATTENSGTFTNNNDGTYTYTYNKNLVSGTFFPVDPATLDYTFLGDANLVYRPNATHRVGLQLNRNIYGSHAPVNAVYDFVPGDGNRPIDPAVDPSKLVAETQNCNACHDGRLGFHGSSSRTEVAYCVTCHNPGTVDGNSGFNLDMGHMIHKIHAGKTLASVVAGEEFIIWGNNNTPHNYSELTYPTLYYSNGRYTNAASVLNCSTCHSASAATPQGDNWYTKTSDLACFSCHDQLVEGKLFIYNNRATYTRHGAAQTNPFPDQQNVGQRNCGGCHTSTTNNRGAAVVHNPHFGTPQFRFDLQNVTVNANRNPVVTFKIEMKEQVASDWVALNLSRGEALPSVIPDGSTTPITLSNGPNFALSYSSNGIDFGPARALGQPQTVTLAALRDSDGFTCNETTGVCTGTLAAQFPADATLRAVFMQGYFNLGPNTSDPRLYTESPMRFTHEFVSPGVSGLRRTIVEQDKCLGCHDVIAFHGGNRVNDPMVCASCHNNRLSSSGHLITSTSNSLGRAGLPQDEVTNNFKDMIHGIHGGTLVGGRNQGTGLYYDFSFMKDEYPAKLSNCLKCHAEGTYLGIPQGTAVTTNNTADRTATTPGVTDLVTTPFAASCVGCHDSVEAKRHMENLGARFKVQRSAVIANSEACGSCHRAGQLYGIDAVHTGLN